jgi:calcineurin-like phosphoesterase family protein
MYHTLIDNGNSRIARNDEVWIVGDFSFRSEQDVPYDFSHASFLLGMS